MKAHAAMTLLAAMLWGSLALPITQIGGGFIADPAIGFQMPKPSVIPFTTPDGHDGLKLYSISTGRFGGPPGTYNITNMRPLSEAYPEFATKTRAQIAQSFMAVVTMPYVYRQHPADPCIDTYIGEHNGTLAVITLWGPTRGVVFVGPADPQLKDSIIDMVDQNTLNPGACQWP